ncbi:MAG: hypothetical protein OES14_00340 [Nitrosopumilus sp.]|nr:hypothetical protein [Nitrosopumilus sp.]
MITSKSSSSELTSKVATKEGIKSTTEITMEKSIIFFDIFFLVDFKKMIREINMKTGAAR